MPAGTNQQLLKKLLRASVSLIVKVSPISPTCWSGALSSLLASLTASGTVFSISSRFLSTESKALTFFFFSGAFFSGAFLGGVGGLGFALGAGAMGSAFGSGLGFSGSGVDLSSGFG